MAPRQTVPHIDKSFCKKNLRRSYLVRVFYNLKSLHANQLSILRLFIALIMSHGQLCSLDTITYLALPVISGDVSRYTWQKDGQPLDLSLPKYERLDEGGSFKIKSPSDEDEGVYQCFARNELGTAVTTKSTLKKAGRWRHSQHS